MAKKTDLIHVFWTGGMDSTFNLVKKLTTTSSLIRPHYIVRHEDSTGNEIDTMISVRRAIVAKFPEIRSRFLPTVYTNEDDISYYKEIDDEIQKLRKSERVHEQYQIMSYYCKQFEIDQIDVSYEMYSDVSATDRIGLAKYFGIMEAFKSFVNPVGNYTKFTIYLKAKENNWHDILDMTSFCRRPKKRFKPCGTCGPCIDVVNEGLDFRLPIAARIKAKIQIPFRIYWRKNFLNHDKGIFRIIKKYFIGKF